MPAETTERRSVREQLRALRVHAQARQSVPDQVATERRQATRAVELAKAELRDAYAALEPGAKLDARREGKLREEITKAEAEVSVPWELRLEGAELAAEQALEAVEEFRQEHADELADELAREAATVRDALDRAVKEFEAALDGYERHVAAWLSDVPDVPPAELPWHGRNAFNLLWRELSQMFPPGEPVPAPVPRSLLALADPNPATTTEEA